MPFAYLYAQILNQPIDFYNNALKYLAYVQLDTLPTSQQLELAFDLGIAALIGDSIYNFGELVCLLNYINFSHSSFYSVGTRYN